ncbi:hypothetical protein BC833DRAFT_569189 [Globomyces pollinis-pini]|nr:hypothetical protein BC833DRAFT_569189 [Globomyces pollinis-pini]
MVSVHGGNASLGRFYWNLAIQFKYSKNVHIEAHLRLIGFLLIYNDKETQLFDDNELQLLIMATKVGIAWMGICSSFLILACNEFGDARTAFLLGCKIKDCDTAPKDHKDFKKASSNLLIHMAQLDWVTSKSPSSFLIINRAIDDSSDHYTFHDIIKVLNICKSLASLSENGDAIKWLKLALRTIDIAPGIPDQYLDIKTHENDIEVYYWKVKVLESKKANDTTFSAILDTVKNIWIKTTKREPTVFQWLDESLQCLRDLMLEETASIVPKLLSNVENLTPSDYILMTSIFLIIESNREDIANQIEKVLENHGPLDLGTPVTNICIPMLWRVADKYANTQCDWGIALDNRDSPTTNFMLFTIYLEFEEVEKALHHLKQITFQKNSELYIMAADVAFEKNQKPLLLDILKTAASGNFVIPDSKNRTRLLIIIRCLIRLMISADTVKDIYSYFDKGIQVLNTLNNTEHDIDAETECQTDLHSHTLKSWYAVSYNRSSLFMCVFTNISILRTQRDSDQVSVTLSSINSLRNQLVANPNESFDTSLIHLVFTMEFEVYCISNQWEQVENLMAVIII